MSLLAVGGYTYTSDLRVESHHEPGSADWLVVIRNLSSQDSGQYECQVSTTPHRSLVLNLDVRGEKLPFLSSGNITEILTVNFLINFNYK